MYLSVVILSIFFDVNAEIIFDPGDALGAVCCYFNNDILTVIITAIVDFLLKGYVHRCDDVVVGTADDLVPGFYIRQKSVTIKIDCLRRGEVYYLIVSDVQYSFRTVLFIGGDRGGEKRSSRMETEFESP